MKAGNCLTKKAKVLVAIKFRMPTGQIAYLDRFDFVLKVVAREGARAGEVGIFA